MQELDELTRVANERFSAYTDALGGAPAHRVEFSPRITTSWALIYYRRRLVRLSPYLFLLHEEDLKHGTYWAELDATLRHEAVHAVVFDRTGETGHSATFHDGLRALGVRANGGCDLGPENAAFRYVYACRSCSRTWSRRLPLRGNWSCAACSPGRYTPEHAMQLAVDLGHPVGRLRACGARMRVALAEARATAPLVLRRPVEMVVQHDHALVGL